MKKKVTQPLRAGGLQTPVGACDGQLRSWTSLPYHDLNHDKSAMQALFANMLYGKQSEDRIVLRATKGVLANPPSRGAADRSALGSRGRTFKLGSDLILRINVSVDRRTPDALPPPRADGAVAGDRKELPWV